MYLDDLRNPTFLNGKGERMPNDSGWQDRHIAALRGYRAIAFETDIVNLLTGWAKYADSHQVRYEDGIGSDGMFGPAWARLGAGIHALLDGETGRLDCGTLSAFIHNTLQAEGFTWEEL